MAEKQTEFPDIKFWDEKAPKITFINPKEFHRDQLLKSMGLSTLPFAHSFGTSDREEILRRQRLIRMFVENPKLRDSLLYGNSDYYSQVPTYGQAFLNHFNPKDDHNPFWRTVIHICNWLRKARDSEQKIAAEAEELLAFIDQTREDNEALEREWAKKVSGEIQKTAEFQGVVFLHVQGNYGINECKLVNNVSFGYRLYSYHLFSNCEPWKIRDWMDFKPIRAFFNLVNNRRARKQYAPLLVQGLPKEINSAIECHIGKAFKNLRLDYKDKIEVCCYFNYDEYGLRVRIVSLDFFDNNNGLGSVPEISTSFKGFSPKQKRQIARMNRKIRRKAQKINRMSRKVLSALAHIKKNNFCLLVDGELIRSKTVDLQYQWPSFSGMLDNNPELKEEYNRIKRYREYIVAKFKILRQIAKIADTFAEKAKQLNRPLTFPEILGPDEHLFSFEELFPIHLIGRHKRGNGNGKMTAKDIVPIRSLHPLNGQMLAFTGQNASGKTVAEEAIVHEIFCAQSGFPTFGKKVALNPKSKIGMVLLERGDGSTVQLMVEKMARVLRSIRESAQNGSVVVLDEVGTGTNSTAGMAIGQKFLQAFAKEGCSMVFSTQIPELAHHAEANFKAICYNFEFDHTISPGIGTSDADRLIARLGVDKLLE